MAAKSRDNGMRDVAGANRGATGNSRDNGTRDVAGANRGVTTNSRPAAPAKSKDTRPDVVLQKMNAVNQQPLNDVQKAVLEAKRQRDLLAPGVKVGSILAPSIIGTGITVGNMMGAAAEDEAAANPERFTTIPGDPGAIKSTSGPLTSNRALPSPAAKSTEAGGTKVPPFEEEVKKKKAPLKTILGPVAAPLGTAANPMKI